jgi:hypothetical protein
VEFNPGNIEALFGLGAVYDGRGSWKDAAGFYEAAAHSLDLQEAALGEKIAEIKGAPLGEARRAAMLAKKNAQLAVNRATRANACYNTAVSWFNAGASDKAKPAAEKAAAHPQFKDKAAALLGKMR